MTLPYRCENKEGNIQERKNKFHTLIAGHLAVIEVNIRNTFKKNVAMRRFEVERMRNFVKELIQLQGDNNLYIVFEAINHQAQGIKTQDKCEEGRWGSS